VINESYDDSPHARFDVYTPHGASSPLPTLVWTHGGAFVGGSKDEIGDYLRMIAVSGLTVVGVEYSRAPAARYPTPVRQVMAALRHLQANPDRLHIYRDDHQPALGHEYQFDVSLADGRAALERLITFFQARIQT
jgi:acetyl esterase/lipase